MNSASLHKRQRPSSRVQEGKGADIQVQFRAFRGLLKSWQSLFQEAADFATELGPERLISISHSEDANEGVVTVWYWE